MLIPKACLPTPPPCLPSHSLGFQLEDARRIELNGMVHRAAFVAHAAGNAAPAGAGAAVVDPPAVPVNAAAAANPAPPAVPQIPIHAAPAMPMPAVVADNVHDVAPAAPAPDPVLLLAAFAGVGGGGAGTPRRDTPPFVGEGTEGVDVDEGDGAAATDPGPATDSPRTPRAQHEVFIHEADAEPAIYASPVHDAAALGVGPDTPDAVDAPAPLPALVPAPAPDGAPALVAPAPVNDIDADAALAANLARRWAGGGAGRCPPISLRPDPSPCFVSLIHRSHSISFTRAQVTPEYKRGLGRRNM
jgi:hypothetical protein